MHYINNDIDVETRFDLMKFLKFNGDNIDPLSSYFLLNIQNLPAGGTYEVVAEEKRPDLISYELYDDTQYWWILMLYNKILDINEFKAGLNIVYPDKSYFETIYQNASLMEKTK